MSKRIVLSLLVFLLIYMQGCITSHGPANYQQRVLEDGNKYIGVHVTGRIYEKGSKNHDAVVGGTVYLIVDGECYHCTTDLNGSFILHVSCGDCSKETTLIVSAAGFQTRIVHPIHLVPSEHNELIIALNVLSD